MFYRICITDIMLHVFFRQERDHGISGNRYSSMPKRYWIPGSLPKNQSATLQQEEYKNKDIHDTNDGDVFNLIPHIHVDKLKLSVE